MPKPNEEPVVLARGRAFHRDVQSAYVLDLLGVDLANASEQRITLANGRRGRADLLVAVRGEPERTRLIVEIKSTDWDARAQTRIRPLFRRHLSQLQGYLDVLIDELEQGEVESVVAALLYPGRPASASVADLLEEVALAEGIMVIYYAEVDWRPGAITPE